MVLKGRNNPVINRRAAVSVSGENGGKSHEISSFRAMDGGGRKPKHNNTKSMKMECLITIILGAGFLLLLCANLTARSKHSRPLEELGRVVSSLREEATPPCSPCTHVVFSTDCGKFQHWQSYLLFYSAMKVGQKGYVTRIASGCDEAQKVEVQKWHDEHVASAMSSMFTVHFTPHFSTVKNGKKAGGEYKFFNKPFGLNHWMENGEHMGLDGSMKMMHPDDIVALIDPDQILLRPITSDFSDLETTIVSGPALDPKTRKFKVEHGQPFGQHYGFGASWQKLDLVKITGDEKTHALSYSNEEGRKYFAVGPPYIGTATDMYAISVKWSEFAPRVHEQLPSLMAEMYAYCSAAAHLGLNHQVFDHGMVSATDAAGEGWPFIDAIPEAEVCGEHVGQKMPLVIHYCQRYIVGGWKFAKRQQPQDFFTCGSPLMKIPPPDLGTNLWKNNEKESMKPKKAQREAFVTCLILKTLNEAANYFKKKACIVEEANLEESIILK